MSEILFHYERVNPTTWVYLSSLLMIGLFFKFGRFWSVRNLDLVLLILLSPGLLYCHYGFEALKDAHTQLRQEKLIADSLPSDPTPPIVSDGDPKPPEVGNLPSDSSDNDEPESEDPDSDSASPDESSPDLAGSADGNPDIEDNLVADAAAEDANTEGSDNSFDEPNPDSLGQTLLAKSRAAMRFGFIWLFVVGFLLLIRLLVDPTMVRRPLLEPNLTMGGLAFLGCSLFVFLMANVISSVPTEDDLRGPKSARALISGEEDRDQDVNDLRLHGPGYALLNLFPILPTMPILSGQEEDSEAQESAFSAAAKAMAILSHLAVVVGMIGVGYWHFDNIKMGIGAATMHLMVPYTAMMTGRIDHVIPAALLVWAVLCYRRPLTSGIFLGLAIGVVYYPLFLLPLWVSFYWQRGLARFSAGVVCTLSVMVVSLLFIPGEATFAAKFQQMFGLWTPLMRDLDGIWNLGWAPVYRIPVLTAFIILSCVALALWPAQKNLGTLMSCSAAVMVATQFWHGHDGGLYMAWYLPLTLLTVFRPNLEDRVAIAVLSENRLFARKRSDLGAVEQAA